MLEFIRLLKECYLTKIDNHVVDDALGTIYRERIDQLILTESFIRKGELIKSDSRHLLQIAVIGPTQVGKSSVTNLLLDSSAAGVSPLAGFTVHPQGFFSGKSKTECNFLDKYFIDFKQVSREKLKHDQQGYYSLTQIPEQSSSVLPSCILWDTPDFDSIDAEGYREGVLRSVALADVVILVVSKEKYADQSVWEMMTLLESLSQPTVIFINKLVEGSQSLILESLQDKWLQARKDPFPDVISLLYQTEGKIKKWPESEYNQVARVLKGAIKKTRRGKHADNQQKVINQYWQAWIEPVKAEHSAMMEWGSLLDDCIKESLKNYQRDYLDHPHHYETFQNALAELLALLEIPGIAKVLVNTRKVLTWPVKKMFGKSRSGKKLGSSDSSHEVALLNQQADHLLIQLADRILEKIENEPEKSHWWKEINSLLRAQKSGVLKQFETSVSTYHKDFQHEVEIAAHRLYGKLQEQPITLNSLRATRVTADAAAVAMALHAGGIGLHDLIITPAMLSVTSLLTESAMGSYMGRIEAELKHQQLETVKQKLFVGTLKNHLTQLPENMGSTAQFNISQEQLSSAEQQLKEKPHGLRLF